VFDGSKGRGITPDGVVQLVDSLNLPSANVRLGLSVLTRS
jgi:hypothetical protein